MKREYSLEGLDCYNCAAKIEKRVAALPGVQAATLAFATGRLVVESGQDLRNEIVRIVHELEPGVKVIGNRCDLRTSAEGRERADEGHSSKATWLLRGNGLLLFVTALLLEWVFHLEWASAAVCVAAYLLLGWDVLYKAGRNLLKGHLLDENFLMSLATIGALFTRNFIEAAAVMLFYQVGEYFQERAVGKSRKSIAALMQLRPDTANLLRGGETLRVAPETVAVGEEILIRPGERVPLDGVVLSGSSFMDLSALTGESVPRRAGEGDAVLSGTVNQSGALTVRVTKPFGESTASKIIEMTQNAASKKAKTEQFITRFSAVYTPVVVGCALLLALLPPLLLGGGWGDWIHRGLIFLVISCPCALVLSVPLGFFGGIGGAGRRGILVKGGNYLEALERLDIAVFDKTGTLTYGNFEVTKLLCAAGVTEEDLLETAARAETQSSHPIAQSILRAYGKTPDVSGNYEEIAGQGVRAEVDGSVILVGNEKLMFNAQMPHPHLCGWRNAYRDEVGTRVYVARDGAYIGCIVVADAVKAESRAALAALKARGVRKTVILTGDDAAVAQAVAAELGVDEVWAGLLPQDKMAEIERLLGEKRPGGTLCFAGDGINDAAALARADIGIAMGALGTDAAMEAADLVLMTDDPTKLAIAMDLARRTKRIVWQNIIFALTVKLVFLALGALGVSGMWEAVFADVGVSLLAVLNAARAGR
ncbi:MAG: cadmium-translocating P-type ATPase [Clostridiales bacterium]|nr:cadmium-translocating P-type ATPase [Clostridiales bacterium]